METPLAARDQWIERAKPTGDDLAQIRKCQRSQARSLSDFRRKSFVFNNRDFLA